MRASLESVEVLVGFAVVAGLGLYVYDKRKSIENAVNPASQSNVVNKAVTHAGQAITGDANWTLGGAIADLLQKPNTATDSIPLIKYSPGWCKSYGLPYPCQANAQGAF